LHLNKLFALIVLVTGFIIFAVVIYGVQAEKGTISGKVTIGPLCPVEPCQDPDPNIYTSRQLILQPIFGYPDYIRLNSDGSFNATVDVGTYTVILTDCTFLGCERSLPIIITVNPNGLTTIDISIDTGIR